MASWLASLALGLIQGLGEFLPISSSGHLVLAQALFGLTHPELVFDLVLHLGTLMAICYFYRSPLQSLFLELKLLPAALISPAKMTSYYRLRPDFHLGILIIVASVPTAIFGLLFFDSLESMFSAPKAVGGALLTTGAFLAATRFAPQPYALTERSLTIKMALAIGLIQGLAIVPGLSRSGLTIGLGLFLGLEQSLAARFSFLLSIPAILGGLILSLSKSLASSFSFWELAVGFLTAGLVGYFSLWLLVRVVKPGRLAYFAPWCVLVGLLAFFM
ncbi:MAG: undecaprenyl-diphosphate phosphatase [Deltaproteobacteria bacterium]|jgi:undecaprenyl-diphosphatase|nr:undecaprenyl-diphosphate phosphatase [Deltaproteobacteria bacterium]